MKTLIIGAKGMLGQALAEKFPQAILLDKAEINIADYNSVDKVVSELKPEIVINAAAYTDVDGCQTNREICMAINGRGPGNLARICKKIDAILIHYSTDYIFNGQQKQGYKEDYNKIEPINIYGESKALGEKLVRENCDKYYILRTAWLHGNNGQNFVDTMLQLASEKDKIKVVNDQHGSPTYAKDLAQRTKYILENKNDFGIYHVTNYGNCTWFEFAQEIFKIKNLQTKLIACSSDEFPRPAKRPNYSILLNTKLPPMRSWQEALKDYLI